MKTGHNSSKPALPWKRIIALALIFIMSAGFAACALGEDTGEITASFMTTPVCLSLAQEVITEENITYTDVLAIYDTLVQDMWDVYHLREDPSFTDNGGNLFISITPIVCCVSTDGKDTEGLLKDGTKYRYPIYFASTPDSSFGPSSPPNLCIKKFGDLLPNPERLHWTIDVNMRHINYETGASYELSMNQISTDIIRMKALARSFGVDFRKATEEDSQVTRGACDTNVHVCDAINITRETIINANQKQLWIIYSIAKSIYGINFFKEKPNLDHDYHADVTAYIGKTRASAEGS